MTAGDSRLTGENERGLCRLRAEHWAMACPFKLELWGSSAEHLRDVAQEAVEVLDQLEQQLSVYVPTSDISWLNAAAAQGPVRVEPDLFELLGLAARLHAETNGAFDITAGPLIRCWGFFQREGAMPDPEELAAVRDRVGWQHVQLDVKEQTVAFDRAGIEINLGAIGKGYALRQLSKLIGRYEVEAALLSSGGSTVAAMGSLPREAGWRIGIIDPFVEERRLGSVWLRDGGLATSGQVEQSFVHEGRWYGHILDPRSGEPVRGLACVWVAAPDPAEADALSTALFVLGTEGARRYCEEHQEVKAYLLTEDETGSGIGEAMELGLCPEEERNGD